jgi:hypothetical protein
MSCWNGNRDGRSKQRCPLLEIGVPPQRRGNARAQQGWLQIWSQRFDSETKTLSAFEPPRQQPPAAACRSLSKEGSGAVFILGDAAPLHAALLKIPSLGGEARCDSGREAPGWVGFRSRQNLPEAPLVQRGTLFLSNLAPQGGMKNFAEA